jgi:GNAT superfamily N-acetyltransferase
MITHAQPDVLTPSDYREADMLVAQARLRHMHLDWREAPAWLRDPSLVCRVARINGQISTLMGATLVPQGEAWLRFILLAELRDRHSLDALWDTLSADLCARGVQQVSALLLEPWIAGSLAVWGFTRADAVVTLRRTAGPIPPPPRPPLLIRPVEEADLPTIAALDAEAFPPLWQHDEATLRIAWEHAATFTVLEYKGHILGYQLSTHYANAGHLARLAIQPRVQGRGLGGLLVSEMLRFFEALQITTITVNTQEHNIRSRRLYSRLGFEETNHSVPIWTVAL